MSHGLEKQPDEVKKLNKLWFCVGGRVNPSNLTLSNVPNVELPLPKDKMADVLRFSNSSERVKEFRVV